MTVAVTSERVYMPPSKTMRTMVRQSVNSVSKRVLSAATVSSTPSSPFSRFRLKRMYQFVSSSTRSSKRGKIVYSRYAAISSRTSLMSDWHRARIQRSMTLEDTGACASYWKSRPVVFLSRAAWPRKKRWELSQGRSTREMTSRTPSSRKRRLSPRTTGELTRNILSECMSLSAIVVLRQGVPCSISTVLVDDEVGVGVVLQTLAHLLPVPA